MIIYIESSIEADEIMTNSGMISSQQPDETSQQHVQEMEHLRAENGKLAKELECERNERQRIEEALIVERESLNSEISELKSQLQVITKQKDGVEKDYQELLSNGNVTELSDTLSETQKELDGVFSLHCNNK